MTGHMSPRYFYILISILAILVMSSCPSPVGQGLLDHVLDERIPEVVITSPDNGACFQQTRWVHGGVSDQGGEILRVDWDVSGPFGTLAEGTVSVEEIGDDGAFSFSFTTTDYGTEVIVSVTAFDWNGNTATAGTSLDYPGSSISSFSADAGNKQVSLSWEEVPGAASYTMYYTTDGNMPQEGYGQEIGPLTEVSGEDSPPIFLPICPTANSMRFFLPRYLKTASRTGGTV